MLFLLETLLPRFLVDNVLMKDLICSPSSGSNLVTFTTGAWSEIHDVLGVMDDTDTLYFIKSNGEEITRILKRHLKVSSPIINLIANDDSDVGRSCL